MLNNLKRRMFPITLSRGLEIVQKLANPQTKTGEWYYHAVQNLIAYHGDLNVTDVTTEMVTAWSISLDKHQKTKEGHNYSEPSKNSYRRAVRAFFNKMEKMGHIARSPTKDMRISDPPKGQPKHLSDNDVAKIRKMARNNVRDHAIIEIIYATGCRISELGTMKVSNLQIQQASDDKEMSPEEETVIELAQELGLQHMFKKDLLTKLKGKLLVVGKGQGGKKKVRWVYFDDEAACALKDYLDSRPHDAPDEIFLNAVQGTPLTRFGFHHIIKKIFRNAGVDGSAHDLRHTFATRLMRNGANPKLVQNFLGHSDLNTTISTYYNPTDEEMWEAYDEYG